MFTMEIFVAFMFFVTQIKGKDIYIELFKFYSVKMTNSGRQVIGRLKNIGLQDLFSQHIGQI